MRMPLAIMTAVVAIAVWLAASAAQTQPGAPSTPATDPASPTAPASGTAKPKPMVLETTIDSVMAERIARQLIAASPIADPGDVKARDEAAQRLAACNDLLDAAGNRILWGGFNPDQGYDPDAYRLEVNSRDDYFQLTELNPLVWTKLYLSTFMFPGGFEVREEGRFTVLSMVARFRGTLDAGEYPYPFWHSPNKWTAYMNTDRLVFVFSSGRLVSAMRVSPNPLSLQLIKREWDTHWTWTDEAGHPQPRVTLFSYVFSQDNPHVGGLDESYRALEERFREENCLTCHAPDNRSRLNDLVLLNYPNQALVARRTLVSVLEYNRMPPGNAMAHEPNGIQDDEVLAELIRLARDFERKADAAFAFERLKQSTAEAAPTPTPAARP